VRGRATLVAQQVLMRSAAPAQVLDAPHLADDFYLNLVRGAVPHCPPRRFRS